MTPNTELKPTVAGLMALLKPLEQAAGAMIVNAGGRSFYDSQQHRNDARAAIQAYAERIAALSAVSRSEVGDEAQPEPWVPYLSDRADGVRGHYAICRWNPGTGGLGYREAWNLRSHRWASCSDEVLTLEEAQKLLAGLTLPSGEPVAERLRRIALNADCLSDLQDDCMELARQMESASPLPQEGKALPFDRDYVRGYLESVLEDATGNADPEVQKLLAWLAERELRGPQEGEDARDAARYRWLRDRGEHFVHDEPWVKSPWAVIGINHTDCHPCSRDDLDEAVDAAMSATLKESSEAQGEQQ